MKVDENMWGDESDDENEEDKEKKEEKDSNGKNGESQSELVAKDDNRGITVGQYFFNQCLLFSFKISDSCSAI